MSSYWDTKYSALERQCRAIETNNFKLMNRIYHVRRITRRAQKERKAIMDQLDMHNDNYRSVDLFFDADVLKESGLYKSMKPIRIAPDRKSNWATNMGRIMTSSHGPSRSANAYFNFCQSARKEILQINPAISQMELAKVLSEKWTRLKPNEKEEYNLMYEQSNDKPKLENLAQHISSELKNPSNTEEDHDNGQQHHILSPNLGSFADGNEGNITLPQIPSPTLVDVDHSFGLSNIPSPSFH